MLQYQRVSFGRVTMVKILYIPEGRFLEFDSVFTNTLSCEFEDWAYNVGQPIDEFILSVTKIKNTHDSCFTYQNKLFSGITVEMFEIVYD